MRAADAAGNTGPAATSTYVLDRTAPAAPVITSSPASPDNDPTPSWSFTAEPGATTECRVDRGATVVSGWAPCTSPRGFDLSAQPDGTYDFGVRATDAAGNTGPTATSSYALDTNAPGAPSITSSPGPVSSGTNPTWQFTGPAGSTLECRLDAGATPVAGWAPCSSPQSYDLSARPDGTYTFGVRAVNAYGTPSATVTDDYVLDTTAPAAPSITASPASPSNGRAPAWSFSAEAGAALECRLDGPSGSVSGWAACTSPHAFDLTGGPDGTYTISVRATDAAGNTGSAATSSYDLDATAPGAPSITAAPKSPGNSSSPSWSFSAQPGEVTECRLDRGGNAVAGWAPCAGSQAFDLTAQPEGSYTFSVRASDAAGNTGPAATSAYELDRVPGALTIDSGPGPAGRDPNPTWSFTGEAGATLACSLDSGGGLVADWAGCSGSQGYGLGGRPDGTYVFAVRASDTAGNETPAQTSSYELDTTPPGRPAITGNPGELGSDASPEWSFNGEDGAQLECRVEYGGNALADWGACKSPNRIALGGGDGLYTLLVRARDAVGNVSADAQSAYDLDTTAPPVPEIDESPGASGTKRTVTWEFSSEAGARFDCRLVRGEDTVFQRAPCTSPQSYNLGGKDLGTYGFAVRAIDRAGNESRSRRDSYELRAPEPAAPAKDEDAGTPATEEPAAGGTAPPGSAPESGAAAPAATTTAKPSSSKGSAKDASEGSPGQATVAQGAKRRAKSKLWVTSGGAPTRRAKASEERPKATPVGKQIAKVASAVLRNPDKGVFPFALLLIVGAFLLIQNRIDRNDPKLALAPTFADPDLEFRPPPGRNPQS